MAAGIALIARNRRALTANGAVAAVVLGTITGAAGWEWAILLVAFFISATSFSRMDASRKAAITAGFAEKGGERDVLQVLANGGVFGALAILGLMSGNASWIVPAAGAIAASTSDTWATEIGTLTSGSARSILDFRKVHPGTSGGVTMRGTLAAAAGAIFISGLALLLGLPDEAIYASMAGGIGGSLMDSLLGATLQSKRWCGQCGSETERLTHTCGAMTTHKGGLRWLDNDGVNAISSLGGALLGAVFLL